MAKTNFCESVLSDGGLKVDRDAGVIRGVKVIGRQSKNGRTYTQGALEQAVKLYSDCDVCIDHPGDAQLPRGMAESFGVLRELKILPEGVFGDLNYIKAHPLAPAIAERAERFPTSFGLSHNAVGSIVAGPDGGDLVESIEHVESVDIVRRPATTAGLFESTDHRKPTMKKIALKKLFTESKAADAPRLVKLLENEFAPMAEAPVEVADAATGDDAIKAGIKSMVNAVLDGDGDASAKLAKIKQILNAEDKIVNGGKDKPAGDKPEGGEAMEQLNNRLARFERREQIRDLLEEDGRSFASLSANQRKLLEEAKDEAGMKALLETWPRESSGGGKQKPSIPGRASEAIVEDYDAVFKQTKAGKLAKV